jgi:N-sulfoglucosamine sulfohydrolase
MTITTRGPAPIARRRVLIAAAVGLLLAAPAAGLAPVQAAPARPNIILITGDDLGLQLSSYGDTIIATPNIDSLGQNGTRFTNAYVTQSSCSSSRSSMFTGLYPHQNGQVGLTQHGYQMNRAYPTIPTILHGAGYRTGIIGKLHVQPTSAFTWDFEAAYGTWPYGTRHVKRVADEARRFISLSSAPFFLKISYVDPHTTYVQQVDGLPARPITAAEITVNTWTGAPVPDADKRRVALYYNQIQRLDDGIGLLLAVLKDLRVDGNTIIILSGDNGGGQVQLGKTDIHEGGVRVPLLIRAPMLGTGPQVRGDLVSIVDFLPTILDVAGVPVPPETAALMTEGRSLVPILRRQTVPWRSHLFAEMNYHNPRLYKPMRMVRDGRYKLVRSYPPVLRGTAGWQLFDLQTDRLERRDLIGDPALAAVRDGLRAALLAWQIRTADPLPH